MAQFARPDADLSIGGWTDQAAGTTNIYQSIDEVSPSDADYVQSAVAPSSAPVAFGLSNIEDPQSSANHILRVRRQKDASGGATIDGTYQLRQGYVNEGSPGTQIASQSDANVPNGWAGWSYTLSAGEADSITNYNDLQVRIVANQV